MNTNGQRTAIVTGAARGIGAATAIRLARDGNTVAVLASEEAGFVSGQIIYVAGGPKD